MEIPIKMDDLKGTTIFGNTQLVVLTDFLGGGLEYFCNFHPRTLGKMNPFWQAYFSDRLVQPPTSF